MWMGGKHWVIKWFQGQDIRLLQDLGAGHTRLWGFVGAGQSLVPHTHTHCSLISLWYDDEESSILIKIIAIASILQ